MRLTLLPAWVYGAIAAVPIAILAVSGGRFDTLTEVGLAIPATVYGGLFLGVALYRRARRG